jgi:hypothetical protein
MGMRDDKYRPRSFVLDDPSPDPVSLINEPVAPDNVSTLVRANQRSFHAVLCEALSNTKGLLARLEAEVHVAREEQREVIRLLYVATRHQVKALAAVLEFEERRFGRSCNEFIDGFSSARPMPIIVNDHNTVSHESWPKMNKLVFG